MINRILGEDRLLVDSVAGTTMDAVDVPFARQKRNFLLVDTAGLRRKKAVGGGLEKLAGMHAISAMENSHVVVLVLDAGLGVHEQDAKLAQLTIERGKALFAGEAVCFSCHGPDGSGVQALGPPLDESEWVTGKPGVLIRIMLHGMTGPVTVAGKTYTPSADMPALGMNPLFTDQKLADIATYIRNEWSNKAPAVTAAEVAKEREATNDRSGRPWTAAELK